MRQLLMQLLSFASALVLAKSQSTCNGVVSFEKISRKEPNPEKIASTGILLEEPDQAVTIDCLDSCIRQTTCFGLTVDYSRSRCSSFEQPPDTAEDFIHSPNTFFQKVCYRNITLSSCGPGRRSWTIDRVLGALLDGFIAREFITRHRLGCSKQCLIETAFNCSSASYEQSTGRCLLSKESRRTQPQAYRDVYLNGTWLYMENQCVEPGSVCAYDRKKGKSTQSVDLLVFANDLDQCEGLCRNETHFICRSYSFLNNRCRLSSDDRISSASFVLPAVPESTYGELVCSSDDCTHGKYLFEKVIGHNLETGMEELIPASPYDCEAACERLGITLCRSAAIDYAKGTCLKLDRNSQGRSGDLKPFVGRTFIEKACLRLRNTSSQRCSGDQEPAAFIRVPGIEFPTPYYSKVLEMIQSRQECQQKCLDESSFICKSALYNEATTECKLSAENLHSLPQTAQLIRNANYKVSHMENTCNDDTSYLAACDTKKLAGQRLIYADKMSEETSLADCESLCRKRPSCRAFSYSKDLKQCLLSAVSSKIPDVQLSVRSGAFDYHEFYCTNSRSTTQPVGGSEEPVLNATGPTSGNESTAGSSYRTDTSSTPSQPVFSDTSASSTSDPAIDAATAASTSSPSAGSPSEVPSPVSISTQPPATVPSTTSSPEPATTSTGLGSPSTSPTDIPPVVASPTATTATEEPTTTFTGEPDTPSTGTAASSPTPTTQSWNESEPPATQTKPTPTEKPQITASPTPSSLTAPTFSTGLTEATEIGTQNVVTETPLATVTQDPNPSSGTKEETTANSPAVTSGTGTTSMITDASSSESAVTNTIASDKPSTASAMQTTKDQTTAPPTLLTAGTKTTLTPATMTSAAAPTTSKSTSPSSLSTTNVTPIPGGKEFCPKNYASTYERIPGFEPVGEYYFALLCGSDPSDPGIVRECSILCSERHNCQGFVVDYNNYLCYGLIAEAVIQHLSLCVTETKDFYNRMCIPASLSCDKLFTFDRIPDQSVELSSVMPRYTIPFITKDACKCLCLEEKKFTCRSLSYEFRNRVCRIYDRSRIHISLTFSRGSEFFENSCASPAGACSYIRPEMDVGPAAVIKSLAVRSLYECKSACDASHAFLCRSFNFVERITVGARSNLCLLHSDNQMTARKGSLKRVPRSLYYQKVCT